MYVWQFSINWCHHTPTMTCQLCPCVDWDPWGFNISSTWVGFRSCRCNVAHVIIGSSSTASCGFLQVSPAISEIAICLERRVYWEENYTSICLNLPNWFQGQSVNMSTFNGIIEGISESRERTQISPSAHKVLEFPYIRSKIAFNPLLARPLSAFNSWLFPNEP